MKEKGRRRRRSRENKKNVEIENSMSVAASLEAEMVGGTWDMRYDLLLMEPLCQEDRT